MENIGPALTVSHEYVTDSLVYLLEVGDTLAAFYGFKTLEGEVFLYDMWVEPAFMGKAIGRELWSHAVQTAEDAGYDQFLIESDPNAEGFYLRMGARRIGTRVSPDSGRTLPFLEYDIRRH